MEFDITVMDIRNTLLTNRQTGYPLKAWQMALDQYATNYPEKEFSKLKCVEVQHVYISYLGRLNEELIV